MTTTMGQEEGGGSEEAPAPYHRTNPRYGILSCAVETLRMNHSFVFNQILTIVLEVLDSSDESICELALLLIVEILKHQKDMMEDYVEIVIEKLLHVTKDVVPKVSSEAERCLSIVLASMIHSGV